MIVRTAGIFAIVVVAVSTTPARAQSTPADPATSAPAPALKLGAYLETYFQWNLRDPSNGVTALRSFDARHDSLALSNAVVDATWTKGALSGRIALQAGDTPDAYYAAGDRDFRNVQEAWVAWATPVDVELAAGLFLSPITPEVVPVRD